MAVIRCCATFFNLKIMTREQFTRITEWQDETFPNSTELSRIKHLIKEVKELEDEAENSFKLTFEKQMEYADCFFLLFGAAKRAGMKYDTIIQAIEAKFLTNKKRVWGEADENGIVQHVR